MYKKIKQDYKFFVATKKTFIYLFDAPKIIKKCTAIFFKSHFIFDVE